MLIKLNYRMIMQKQPLRPVLEIGILKFTVKILEKYLTWLNLKKFIFSKVPGS